jgi:uncharacterized phage infection (PIP) family protein YhgE
LRNSCSEGGVITNALLSGVLLIGVATLIVAVRTLLSSRRSERLGENWYELLRDQQERLQLLREERRMFVEELERESLERRQLMEILEGGSSQLAENLRQWPQKHVESAHRTKQQEQERLRLEQQLRSLQEELEREHTNQSQIELELERLRQERQRLTEDLDGEREERLETQRQAERRDQERMRLEQELQHVRAELDRWERSPVPEQAKNSEERFLWRRNPVLVGSLLIGVLVAWFVSLLVALSLLAP